MFLSHRVCGHEFGSVRVRQVPNIVVTVTRTTVQEEHQRVCFARFFVLWTHQPVGQCLALLTGKSMRLKQFELICHSHLP